jgi:hypothetical protein
MTQTNVTHANAIIAIMADANNASDHSLLWGYPLEFWDRVGIWSLVAGATVGVAALLLTAASAYILYRVADEAQIALKSGQSSSNERIADLVKQSDQLRKDTAEANARAAEAKLELARFKEPRTLSSEAKQRIADKIKKFANTDVDFGTANDHEHLGLVDAIEDALRSAGWNAVPWNGVGTVITRPGHPTAAMAIEIGVSVQVHVRHAQSPLHEASQALAAALEAEGLRAREEFSTDATPNTNQNAVHVIVGKKP